MDSLLQLWGQERYAATLDRIRRFWLGLGDDRFMVSIQADQPAYRQVYDTDQILDAVPRQLDLQAKLPGANLPTAFFDFGTVSTARYWGGTRRFDAGVMNAYIDPVASTIPQAMAIQPRPVDDPDMDAAWAVDLFNQLGERLETRSLWMRTPDMQGPLNTAGLIMDQEELLMELLSEPESAQPLLDRVTRFLIEFQQYLRQASGQQVAGNIWPYITLPSDIGFCMTEDMMPLVGSELYRDIALPYLKQMTEALGGVFIHCCGDYARHVPALADSDLPLLGIEFHDPHTTIEHLKPLWGKTVFVPGGPTPEACKTLLDQTPDDVRFWFAFTQSTDEAITFARDNGF